MTIKRGIDLAGGGAAWQGWRIGPYGRAKDWRLFSPTGDVYTVDEVAQLGALLLDVAYLKGRVRELEQERDGLTAAQLATIREAAAILERTINEAPRKKRAPHLRIV